MRSKIILSVFALFLFSVGCGDSNACKNLTWEAKEASTNVVGLRISAGDKCENYNDYYDGDLNKIVKQIQSMKIVLNRRCVEMIEGNEPEETEVDCPEFVPETIEFGEMVKCEFQTPPSSMSDCAFYGPSFFFNSSDERMFVWLLIGDNNPEIRKYPNSAFRHEHESFIIEGYFKDENLTTAGIVFTWTEGTEEKTLEFSATVETKE